MCIGCDWSKFRNFLNFNSKSASDAEPSRRRLLQAGAAFAAASVTPTPVAAPTDGGKADLVFRNGPVYTVNGGREWARAVAVQHKQIVYVGDDAGVRSFIGPRTRVMDLAGKMLLPGFVEGHIHPFLGSVLTPGRRSSIRYPETRCLRP